LGFSEFGFLPVEMGRLKLFLVFETKFLPGNEIGSN
jgi:hypothetical protein